MPGIAHVGGEVCGPDEDAVNAIDREDFIEVVEGGAAFGLNQQADLIIGGGDIVGDFAKVRGAASAGAHASDAFGRVAHGAGHFGGMFGSIHHGHQNGLRASIQHLFDHPGLTKGDAHHGLGCRTRSATMR